MTEDELPALVDEASAPERVDDQGEPEAEPERDLDLADEEDLEVPG